MHYVTPGSHPFSFEELQEAAQKQQLFLFSQNPADFDTDP